MFGELDQQCINTIRFLSVDAVQKAEQRPSGHAARRRADGLRAVDALAQAQSAQPALVRSRPLRALGRARLDAALQPAAPDRLRPVAGRHQAASASGAARRRAIPSAATRRAWRSPPGRSARASPTRVGHGDRRGAARGALQPPGLRRRSTTPPTRIVSDGDLMEGVAVGGGLARRPSAARQADLPVRRQPRHARGRHRHHVHRRSRAPLRGLRLAHA